MPTGPADSPPPRFGQRLNPRLRGEIFALGGRHRGDALAGARRELEEPGLSAERRDLLQQVERHLSRGEAGRWGRAKEKIEATGPTGRLRLAYIAAILASAAWIGLLIGGRFG